MEELIPMALHFLEQYGYLIVFFGAVAGGEIFILAASFMASLGYFNIYAVVLISLAGIILSDSLWYLLGRKGKNFILTCKNWLCLKNYHNRLLDRYFNSHYGKLIILSKFVYGTRIVTMITSGYKKVPYRKFFYYNLLSIIIWIIIVVSLGYLLGFSWNRLSEYNSYIKYSLLLVLVGLAVLRLAVRQIIKFKHYESGN
ncbi:MAG TPA: DedA family protein [bacterium]|nr:DedA family protein [bacterium]HNS33783.1 DedA family protein [bacterium]HNZ73708.1 DedA family protein [bacterium]HOH66943.1 DedA family protein [bacterium]